jgi:tRNA nucleotidyltransferase (CCA-adding enzyme)
VLVARHHHRFRAAPALSAADLVDALEAVDVYRRPERFEQFLLACRALYAEPLPARDAEPLPTMILRLARAAASTVDPRALVRQGLKGEAIKRALREQRIEAVQAAVSSLTRRATGDRPPTPGDRG